MRTQIAISTLAALLLASYTTAQVIKTERESTMNRYSTNAQNQKPMKVDSDMTKLPCHRQEDKNPSISNPERWYTTQDGSITCYETGVGTHVGDKSLVDILTVDRRGSLWWEYARDVVKVTTRLSSLELGNTTLLVPVNSAIMKLPRKPHQNEGGETTDEEAQSNTERFLAAHIVPDFNDIKTSHPVKTLLGTKIELSLNEDSGKVFVNPGDIEVLDVGVASNGRVLYMNGVLPF